MSWIASPHLRQVRLVLGVVIGIALLLWGGCEWLVSTAQARLKQRLAERGLTLTASSQTWSIWGGIRLNEAALSRLSLGKEPLIEFSGLHVGVLWRDAWRLRSAVTRWQADDATLTLTDDLGAVSFQHLTTDFTVRDDRIVIAKLETNNGAIAYALGGEIILATATGATPDTTFKLDLKPLRAVLAKLAIKTSAPPFTIGGTFALDLRPAPVTWSADLRGAGKQVEWHEVPIQEAELTAHLSQAELKLSSRITFAQGSAQFELTRSDWDQSPLHIEGTLADSAGRSDAFKGQHQGSTGTLTIARISGNANLLELARNVPSVAAALPAGVTVTTFPDIVAEKLVLRTGAHSSDWTLESLQVRKAAALTVVVRNHPVNVDHLTGRLSYDHRRWRFEELKGQMLGGRFTLDGSYDGKILSKANVTIQTMQLGELTPWLGKMPASLEHADLSLIYRGGICNDPENSTGTGSVALTHAPVVHVPLLDQAYTLFPKIIPHERHSGVGEVDAKFSMTQGFVTLEPMKVRGEAVVVTARGTIDLNRRVVDGHARANLRGVAGVVLSPISVLFMEMKVTGPLDDIRVSPLGVLGAAKVVAVEGTKLSSAVLRQGLALPFEALGLFHGGDKPAPARDAKSKSRQ